MAKLESLIVDIQANTAELRKGLDEASKKLDDFDKQLKEVAGVVEFAELGRMALEVSEKLAEFAMHGAELAEQTGKLATAAGISAEAFSRLNYAAALNGVSTEDLSKGLLKLNQNIAEAGAGSVKQVALFNALGVSVRDASGNVRPMTEVLGDLSDKFSKLSEGASKIDLAKELMGKGGPQMVQFLNETAAGLAEAGDQADRFGITVSGETSRAAKEFNDNLITMRMALDGVAVHVAGNLAPTMKELSDQLLKSSTGAQSLKDLAEALSTALRVLTTVAVAVAAAFQVAGAHLAALASALVHLGQGDLKAIGEDFQNLTTDAVATIVAAGSRIAAVWDDTSKAAEGAGEVQKQSADKVVHAFKAGELAGTKYAEAVKELQKALTGKMAEVAGFGLGPMDKLIAELDSGKLTGGVTNFSGKLGEIRDQFLAISQTAHDLQLTQLSVQLDFKLGQELDKTMGELARRAGAFSGIGLDQREQIQALISQSGIKSFDDALQHLGEATDAHARALADVALAEKEFGPDSQEVRNAEAAAAIQGRMVESATKVADGFQKLGELDYAQFKANVDRFTSTFSSLASSLVSKLGELGSTIQAGVQGFQSGGPWGAIAAVVLDLFTKFNRFAEVTQFATDQLHGLLRVLAPDLSTLTDSFKLFMRVMGDQTSTFARVLGPALQEFGRVLGDVAGLAASVSGLVEAIVRPLFDLQKALGALLNVVDPLKVGLQALSFVTNVIGLAFDVVAQGLENALADFLDGIYSILHALKLDDWANAVSAAAGSLRDSAKGLQTQIDALAKNLANPFASSNNGVNGDGTITALHTFGMAAGYAYNGVATLGTVSATTAANMQKVNEQLTNLPQGFRYALRAYQATTASSTFAPGGGGDVNITVQGSVVTENQLIDTVSKGLARQQFRVSGHPGGKL